MNRNFSSLSDIFCCTKSVSYCVRYRVSRGGIFSANFLAVHIIREIPLLYRREVFYDVARKYLANGERVGRATIVITRLSNCYIKGITKGTDLYLCLK